MHECFSINILLFYTYEYPAYINFTNYIIIKTRKILKLLLFSHICGDSILIAHWSNRANEIHSKFFVRLHGEYNTSLAFTVMILLYKFHARSYAASKLWNKIPGYIIYKE